MASRGPGRGKAAAFAAGLGLNMLSHLAHGEPSSSGDIVRGLYDALLSTMKNGRARGRAVVFTRLEPVICRSFDTALMARLAVGLTWSSLTEAQRQQVTGSFARYLGDLR